MPIPTRQLGTGLVRTLVVASTTLAILLVCFSIYQYGNPSENSNSPDPTDKSLIASVSDPESNSEDTPIASSALVGGGHQFRKVSRFHMTLYPPEGKEAWGEIEGSNWTPVAGANNEFLLTDPEVRIRTDDGHPARISARSAILETQTKANSGLVIRRGKLTGNVVVEFDRINDKQRKELLKSLPPDSKAPSDIVRMETQAIEFDIEYSKLIVPGRLKLTASDVDLDVSDLEVRFNEAENRVEFMRIGRGGRLVLRAQSSGLSASLPSLNQGQAKTLSLTQWILKSIEAKIAATAASGDPKSTEDTDTATASIPLSKDGIPIVRSDDEKANSSNEPPIRYFARFEGDVIATQRAGDEVVTELSADALEIIRTLADKVAAAAPATPVKQQTGDKPAPPPNPESLVLTWSTRLLVEACLPDDQRCAGEARSRIVALGSPAKISNAEGHALFSRLTFEPDTSKVWFEGTDANPVQIRLGDRGELTGRTVHSFRDQDKMFLRVEGPGSLVQTPIPSTEPDAPANDQVQPDSVVEFSKQLELHGHYERQTKISVTGRISRPELRILERATVLGSAELRRGDLGLSGDALDITFDPPSRRSGNTQTIRRIQGDGHVVMRRGANRLSCREIDMLLTADQQGANIPVVLTALGDVVALQDDRTIEARDKLIVDFEQFLQSPRPFNAAAAYAKAQEAGKDITTIDWEAQRKRYEAKVRTGTGVKRLRAWGDVAIHDPVQGLELAAETFDCTVANGSEIQTAIVDGLPDRPAEVTMNALTVKGKHIDIDAVEQSAVVPGEGRLTFRSRKDLDGRMVKTPVPIAITWTENMSFKGRENRALFEGKVHATSANTTTFDSARLLIEFMDVPTTTAQTHSITDWWVLQDVVDRFARKERRGGSGIMGEGFSKEPSYIEASGHAVALTSDFDPQTGELKSRARIAGPKLSVYLQPDISRMQIEGAGSLLLEDYRPMRADKNDAKPAEKTASVGLFGVDDDSGPSNTLITWKDLMWYDFGVSQTRFEGEVDLKYFSGAQLARIRGQANEGETATPSGRSTFLNCNVLTVDFMDRGARATRTRDRRMGRLSADLLRQFHAQGRVKLQDQAEGLWLTAEDLIYEQQRQILVILGSPTKMAYIVKQRPGRLPIQARGERFLYNLETGNYELSKPTMNVP